MALTGKIISSEPIWSTMEWYEIRNTSTALDSKIVLKFHIFSIQLKEFSKVTFVDKVLSIETIGEVNGTPYLVFIVAENGIYELGLRYG